MAISRVLSFFSEVTIISLGSLLPKSSSDLPPSRSNLSVQRRGEPAARDFSRRWLLVLHPIGFCAPEVTFEDRELLPRVFTLTCSFVRRSSAVYSLCHWSVGLSTPRSLTCMAALIFQFGARTFLPWLSPQAIVCHDFSWLTYFKMMNWEMP